MAATTDLVAIEDSILIDPAEAAESAGLRYVSDAEPGLRRRRRGRGFSYHGVDGALVREPATIERVRALAIPPAWSQVWICADPTGHLQATGRDAKGRKQYRYHRLWRAVRDENKYANLLLFGHALPDLRDRVDAALRRQGMSRDKVLALVMKLLDETLVRIGNQEYATDNESYGLTTVTPDHVELSWSAATLSFVGKGGVDHEVRVDDPRLARLVRRCHELGGQSLFSFEAEDGSVGNISSTDVNDHLHDVVGPATSAKDFRTWGGTISVVRHLGPLGPPGCDGDADAAVIDAIDRASAALRNTRAVCRNSYVHPAVLEAYRSGELDDHWRQARARGQLDRAERTALAVLETSAVEEPAA